MKASEADDDIGDKTTHLNSKEQYIEVEESP